MRHKTAARAGSQRVCELIHNGPMQCLSESFRSHQGHRDESMLTLELLVLNVQVANQQIHQECFACVLCNRNLAGQQPYPGTSDAAR